MEVTQALSVEVGVGAEEGGVLRLDMAMHKLAQLLRQSSGGSESNGPDTLKIMGNARSRRGGEGAQG
jgi:hypothetical protein